MQFVRVWINHSCFQLSQMPAVLFQGLHPQALLLQSFPKSRLARVGKLQSSAKQQIRWHAIDEHGQSWQQNKPAQGPGDGATAAARIQRPVEKAGAVRFEARFEGLYSYDDPYARFDKQPLRSTPISPVAGCAVLYPIPESVRMLPKQHVKSQCEIRLFPGNITLQQRCPPAM